MLSPYAKREWLTILTVGLLLAVSATLLGWWWIGLILFFLALALSLFFRDPVRNSPTQRNVMVSPADGKVSSIHEVEHFEPFGEGALCVRVFLSVLDVHMNRAPCHARVGSVTRKAGKHLNALNPQSAEDNESNLIVLLHPVREEPIAAVRQVAGLLARTIHCSVKEGDILQRGQRVGLIKLGSTTELYVPLSSHPEAQVRQGQYVYGGTSIMVRTTPLSEREDQPNPGPQQQPL